MIKRDGYDGITIQITGHDDILAAIDREMVYGTYTSRGPCAVRKKINLPITIQQKIEGAHAMLHVCLRIMGDDRIWNP